MIVDAADNVGDLLTGLHNTAAGLASGLVDGLVDDQDSLAGIDENLGVNAGLTSSGALAQDIRERLAIFGIDVPGAAPTWLPPHGVGSAMKSMGYRVRNPVACINSMVGSVLVCKESESRPEWVDRNIVLDMLILTRTVISKLLTFNTADDWIAQLEDRFDEDDDGDVDISELQAFIAEDEGLSKNKKVLRCLKRAEKLAMNGGTCKQMLMALEPVRELLRAGGQNGNDEDGGAPCHDKAEEFLTGEESITRNVYAAHICLEEGWKDPRGVRVRPLNDETTCDALSYLSKVPIVKAFAALMGPLIDELEDAGLEVGKSIRAFPYDWRVAIPKLEERDGYFTSLMDGIEQLVAAQGHPAVLLAHSMGCRVAHYFTHWVVSSPAGVARGGREWLDKYVNSLVAVAGPFLGATSGTHQYIIPGTVNGLVPAVLSVSGGHTVMRSWGSMFFLFLASKALRGTPISHPCWVRSQGVLQIELISLDLIDTDADSDTDSYVVFTLRSYRGGPIVNRAGNDLNLTSAAVGGAHPVYNELFQFSWDAEPDSLPGLELTVCIKDERLFGTDPAIGEYKLLLSDGDDATPATRALFTRSSSPVAPPIQMVAGERIELHRVPLGESGAKATLNLRWLPSDFTPAGYKVPHEGIPGCGGEADTGECEVATKRLQESLGDKGEVCWPFRDGDERCDGRSGSYRPVSMETMFALEEMFREFEMWQGLYAGDPVFSANCTAAPEIKRVLSIHGCAKPTMAAVVYRRRSCKFKEGQRTCLFEPDGDAQVAHEGFRIKNGVIYEMPNAPQVNVESKKWSDADQHLWTFTSGSGDRTVNYSSLKWPLSWRQDGLRVDEIEIPGADHRGIVSMPMTHFSVLQHVCRPPQIKILVSHVYLGEMRCGSCYYSCRYKPPPELVNDELRVTYEWDLAPNNMTETVTTRLAHTEWVPVAQAHCSAAWATHSQTAGSISEEAAHMNNGCRFSLEYRSAGGDPALYPGSTTVKLCRDDIHGEDREIVVDLDTARINVAIELKVKPVAGAQ